MRPELFKQFGIAFPSYFVLLLTGFVFAGIAAAVTTRREGLDPDVMIDTNLAMLLAGVAGARILHVLADGYFWDYVHLCTNPAAVDWKISQAQCLSETAGYDGVWDAAKNVCHPKGPDCFAWAKFWAGGLTYYGGFIGATAIAVPLLKRDRFPFWKAADYAAIGIPLGLAFGRMGCVLAGCCFGAECHLPWAFSFPAGSPASEAQFESHLLVSKMLPSLPVHPTQVYESAASLAISAICWFWVNPRKRYDGEVFVWFLALYAAARFVIEILRRDARGGLVGLSTSQLIGLGLIGAAYAIHRVRLKTGEEPAPAVESPAT
ncbi:MAG: prolipoprotein diacylglyceryl transferase [Polyangiales bacterium]